MALNKFLVPQFITTEPKILGPVTIRQFITVLVGVFFDFIAWNLLVNINQNAAIALVVTGSLIIFTFAFARVNGQAFHYFILNIIITFKRPSLKIWKKDLVIKLEEIPQIIEEKKIIKRLPPKSRLSDISLLVDTGGAYNLDLDETKSNLQEINI